MVVFFSVCLFCFCSCLETLLKDDLRFNGRLVSSPPQKWKIDDNGLNQDGEVKIKEIGYI